jgi:hypothetical protein
MKMRTMILVVILTQMLAGSAALAYSGGPPLPVRSITGNATLSGGNYRLVSLAPGESQAGTWQASGIASGADYRLLPPAAPGYTEDGCCCTYLPCVWRK